MQTTARLLLSVAALLMVIAVVTAEEAHCLQGCRCRPWPQRHPVGRLEANCSHLGLATLPGNHFSHHLAALDASGNSFGELHGDFFGLSKTRLEHVDLSNSSITKISPTTFLQVPSLWILNLTANKLESLDPLTFASNDALWLLVLRGNALDVLAHDVFLKAARLPRLDLSANGIRGLTDATFSGTPALVSLSLADNQLRTLRSSWFRPLPHLVLLNLHNNQLTRLSSDVFVHLPRLFELRLSGNRLVVPSTEPFLRALNLEYLFMNDCDLGILPPHTFDLMPRVRILWLSHNRLRELHVGQFQALQNLFYLHACGNGLVCNCALKELRQWAVYHRIESDVSCYTDVAEAEAAIRDGTGSCDSSWDELELVVCNASVATALPMSPFQPGEGPSLATLAGYVMLGVVLLLLTIAAVGVLYWRFWRQSATGGSLPRNGSSAQGGATYVDMMPLSEEHDDAA